jgi:hypothetical protein
MYVRLRAPILERFRNVHGYVINLWAGLRVTLRPGDIRYNTRENVVPINRNRVAAHGDRVRFSMGDPSIDIHM